MIMTFLLTVLLMVFLYKYAKNETILYKAIVPGVLTGVILVGEPGLWPVVIPSILTIFLFSTRKQVISVFVFLGSAIATAIMAIPLSYYLFYSPHPTASAGWSIITILITGAALLISIGLFVIFKINWRKALVILSAVILIPFFPFPSFETAPDTRGQAIDWIEKNAEKGTALVIPLESQIDAGSLREDYRVFSPSLDDIQIEQFYKLSRILDNPIIVLPEFQPHPRDPLTPGRITRLNGFREKIGAAVSFQGAPVFPEYYYPIKGGNPSLYTGKIKRKYFRDIPSKSYKVWNSTQRATPGLETFSIKGEFEVAVIPDRKFGNVLKIQNVKPGPGGRKRINFGYMAERKDFQMPIPVGKSVHFIVDSKVVHMSPETHCWLSIRTRDKAKEWDTELAVAESRDWSTFIVSKKVQPGTVRLLFSIVFLPRWTEEKLLIKNIDIVVTE